MISIVYNQPWQLTTKKIPDKYFDWVIDDFPYGINVGNMSYLKADVFVKQKNGNKLNSRKNQKRHKLKEWDLQAPTQCYFDEMVRISKNQILFGIEYVDWNGVGSGRIKWNKGVAQGMSFSQYEIAYCSSINHTHEIDLLWSGMMQAKNLSEPMSQQGNKKFNEKRVHPCQKPVLLYKRLALDFNLKGKKIYCAHNGSGSDRIAFNDYVSEFIANEIDEEYFLLQENRYKNHISNYKLF